jgi:lysophospholipase L1-like esterase
MRPTLALICSTLAFGGFAPAQQAKPHDFARWEKEVAAYEAADRAAPPAKGGVLFAGSSTIRLWTTLAADYPDHAVLNRGVGGCEIADCTHFADRLIFPHAPKQIFLRAGGNDIHAGRSPTEVAADFAAFVTTVHAKLPTTEIVYVAVNPAPARWGETDKYRELNALILKAAAKTPRVSCVDAFDVSLTPAGLARPELFVADELHFNADGYKLLAERVRPHLMAGKVVRHGLLVTGGETVILDAGGAVTWQYPHASRDGWVLPTGNVLLALSKSAAYPGGAAVEVDPAGKIVFTFKGTQSEVNTVQPLAGGVVLLTEAGDKPRLLEVARDGKILAEVPLQAQTKDHHMQSRMARKLATGNYLVPQLLDRLVREYDPAGKIVWEAKTPHMPFTAVRLPDGNTLVGCTHGNLIVELDPAGKEVWRLTNDDLPGKPINDACGVQRLPNGNTVFTSYNAKPGQVKLTEVTRDKAVVWTHTDARKAGIHHFQILDAAGKPGPAPLR